MHTKNIGSRSFALSLYFGAVTAALGAPAELDPTFGANGLVRVDVEQADDAAAAIFAKANGKSLFEVRQIEGSRNELDEEFTKRSASTVTTASRRRIYGKSET